MNKYEDPEDLASAVVLVAVAGVAYAAGAAKGKQAINVTASELEWVDLAPGTPLKMAKLWGDAQGRIRDAAADAAELRGRHAHPHRDYHAVACRGLWVHTNADGNGKELPPGSYVFQPGKQPHNDLCKGPSECIALVHGTPRGTSSPREAPGDKRASRPAREDSSTAVRATRPGPSGPADPQIAEGWPPTFPRSGNPALGTVPGFSPLSVGCAAALGLVRSLRWAVKPADSPSLPINEVAMRSTSLGSPAHRAKPILTLSIALLAAAAGCDVGNTPPPTDPQPPAPMKDLQEVGGAVQSWRGEAEASCGARLVVTRFNDDVGARAGVETRTLITTAEAYRSFGHPAPAGVQLGREWVVFYSPGRTGGGYTPDVGVVGVRGDVFTS